MGNNSRPIKSPGQCTKCKSRHIILAQPKQFYGPRYWKCLDCGHEIRIRKDTRGYRRKRKGKKWLCEQFDKQKNNRKFSNKNVRQKL